MPFVGFKNIEQISEHTLEENLSYHQAAEKRFPDQVIIASIMGAERGRMDDCSRELMTSRGRRYHRMQLLLPAYGGKRPGLRCRTESRSSSRLIQGPRDKGRHLPILAKMTPNIGNMELPAIAAIEAGATGIAAINTIKSIMNVNLDTFASGPDVLGKTSVGGYSGKAVKPIALRFIQSMKSCEQLKDVPVSGMGGIETWRDAAEFMALGCENIQVTTSVMQYGYRIIEDMIEGMRLYLGAHGYKSVSEIVGKALPESSSGGRSRQGEHLLSPDSTGANAWAAAAATLSCYDGGHQALRQDEKTGTRFWTRGNASAATCASPSARSQAISGERQSIRKIK